MGAKESSTGRQSGNGSSYGYWLLHGRPDERRQVGRTVSRLQRQRVDVETHAYRTPTAPIFEVLYFRAVDIWLSLPLG